MGLNMDVDHVAFAEDAKFDGRMPRKLTPAELAQIAGRAGRHMNDGTFGVTMDCRPFGDEVVAAIEEHRFEALRQLQWRSSALSFATRSEEHTSELQSLMRISYAVFCLKKKKTKK